jgi:hypothetical protein
MSNELQNHKIKSQATQIVTSLHYSNTGNPSSYARTLRHCIIIVIQATQAVPHVTSCIIIVIQATQVVTRARSSLHCNCNTGNPSSYARTFVIAV